MKSQLFFADSLTSTLLDWLIYATCLSVLTRLHSHIQLMLEWVLSLYFLATSKRSSINPRPRLQLVLPVIDGVSLLVEQTHDKFLQRFFEAILVRISLISEKTVDVQWFLALVGGGNPSDSPRRLSWSSLRTWMVPCQGWSFQNLIASNRF